MSDTTIAMVGEVRRTITIGKQSLGLTKQLGLDFLGNPTFSQVLASKALRAAAGARFAAVMGSGSTFLAPVTAYPTTTLTIALWNGEPDGGKSLFIDRLFSFLASGTPGAGGCLLACVTRERQTSPTLSTGENLGYANTKLQGLSGKLPGSSKAVFINNITALSAPTWMVVGSEPSAPATNTIATHGIVAEIDGGIVVPPGYMLGMAYLSAAGSTPLYGFGAVWDEIQADLE